MTKEQIINDLKIDISNYYNQIKLLQVGGNLDAESLDLINELRIRISEIERIIIKIEG